MIPKGRVKRARLGKSLVTLSNVSFSRPLHEIVTDPQESDADR
jgi:hypothetical protein